MSKTFQAIATLIGTIIGAGILGIPYVIKQSGLGFGILNLIIVAAAIITIHLHLGEISLRTKNNHQLTGYAERYLGKKGKTLMFIAFAFGIYSALIAYLIGEGQSLSVLIFNTSAYTIPAGIVFWLALATISYFGIRALTDGEETGVVLILIMLISIGTLYWNKIDVANLTYNNPAEIFTPFGVVLFAFLGFAAIPVIERILKTKQEKKLTRKIIIIANLSVFAIYLFFTIVVLGSQGQLTPPVATLSLGKPFILLGMITMFTSFLALTIALIDTFHYDYNLSRNKSWLLTIAIPIIAFIIMEIFKIANFTKVIGIGGVVSGGLTGILIMLMHANAKSKGDRKPEYKINHSKILTIILIAVLTIGAVLEIFSSI